MPFKSKAQQRFLFAAEDRGEVPRGTARRWAHHTPDIKALPERVAGSDEDDKTTKTRDKKAFFATFLTKCAAAGVTDPAQLTQLVERMILAVESRTKQADATTLGGKAMETGLAAGVLGSLVLPAGAGFALGGLAGNARNQVDQDDATALRSAAEANAYRRRAAEAKAYAQVKKLVASNPSTYVPV